MAVTKITPAQLIEAAIASAMQAAQILRHAAMETDNQESAAELWQRAKRLEETVNSPLNRWCAGTRTKRGK